METLPDTFVHPAGFCQNVLATGRCTITGSAQVIGREPRSCSSATIRGRPRSPAIDPISTSRIAVDRETGVILRFVESIGGPITRHAEVVDFGIPTRPLPPSAFEFVFPTGTTMLY